jgi:hypothetical protein
MTAEQKMEVVDEEPYGWFLLSEGNALFLDVNCEHGAVGYSVLVELDQYELALYRTEGHTYLNRLAQRIHESAPGVINSRSPYTSRNIECSRGTEVSAAVRAWRNTLR